jgi:hypothetical protein
VLNFFALVVLFSLLRRPGLINPRILGGGFVL